VEVPSWSPHIRRHSPRRLRAMHHGFRGTSQRHQSEWGRAVVSGVRTERRGN